MLLGFLATRVLLAGISQKPEDLGAHRADVSDKAQVELLVDLLKGMPRGEQAEEILRRHAAPGFDPGSFAGAAQDQTGIGATTAVEIEGTTASAVTGSSRMMFQKSAGQWKLTSLDGVAGTYVTAPVQSGSEGPSVGHSFVQVPVSQEHGIQRLSKGTTRSMLNRALMSATGQTASYYNIHYLQSAPFIRSTYIQFVVDREWNRILYGNLNHWIKTYNDVSGPVAIAVDPDGRVFISETGSQKISVAKIVGEESEASLMPLFSITGLAEPGDIALNDGGTPLDVSDDVLYVAEPAENHIVKYALGSGSATMVATIEGFDNPSALAAGRWNGSNTGVLYVVDKTGTRIQVFQDQGTSLSLMSEIKGTVRQYFQNIETDHFGNLYVIESTEAQILKYTAELTYLDSDRSNDVLDAPGALDIPFGRITIDGEGTYWAGFDQVFAVERWSETSGAQRRMLGLALRDIRLLPDTHLSTLYSSFILTDFGNVNIKVFDTDNQLVRTVHSGWMASGRKSVAWDRRSDAGGQVKPGSYRIEIEGTSPYREETTVSQTEFYLPLYYWQNCGSNYALDDAMLVQGSAVQWGATPSQTVNEHATSVQYRFEGLNPESEYQVAAEYAAQDGKPRLQDLFVDGTALHEPISVTSTPSLTGYLTIPKESYADGEILISVNRRGEGTATISQLWLKETGVGFNSHQVDETTPTSFALEQNYPNPFNPSTVIRYSLPIDAELSLKVYDITGREVATLASGLAQAGNYEVTFDTKAVNNGRGIASGVYFYRVQAGQFSETKKMVLLK